MSNLRRKIFARAELGNCQSYASRLQPMGRVQPQLWKEPPVVPSQLASASHFNVHICLFFCFRHCSLMRPSVVCCRLVANKRHNLEEHIHVGTVPASSRG